MYPVERLRRTLARQPVDRVPVGPYLANGTATLAGLPLSTYCSDARRMAEVWRWLTANGIEGELRAQLVLDANKRTSEEAARNSLLSLGLGGMFRNWG